MRKKIEAEVNAVSCLSRNPDDVSYKNMFIFARMFQHPHKLDSALSLV